MYDVIIIGGGPAGLTAAIYSSRSGLKTLIIAGFEWGGQLMLTTEVENFPGFKRVLGPDLMDKIWKQAEKFDTEFLFENVTAVDFSKRPFKIFIKTKLFEGKTVIIATGSSPKWLGLKNEKRLRGHGVSICATCDAAFFKDKKTIVVGGGDTAMEEAIALSKFAQEVKILHRRATFKASKILQEEVFKNPKIEVVWNILIQDILGKEKVEGVKVKKTDTGKEFQLRCDAVFLAIGNNPNTGIFRDQIELDKNGYIEVERDTRSSVSGIFVAGDVHDSRYRQAITSAGDGCKAALDAHKYIEENWKEAK